ncbi:substrate-binding periplasmic protein [Oceanospirillum sediminis]|uniref:Transporter substrate-binding domain-containing protein n=1 Tax=Oceanospirillum sediminis TaxID=2760088 RepID=A0A839IUJ5_9GAMM|nr:transporter substrate-binding domain-containing protein [Oceanospirillum sediminis]MBB1488149.1 transporter substrate-binding domain-containing protein [Oceanospirillum sediminis]
MPDMHLFCSRLMFLLFLFLSGLLSADTDKKTLIVVGEEFAPYEFVRNGQVVGMDIDICNRVFEKMGYDAEYRIMPWKRAWYHVEKGLADVILTTSRKPARQPYVWYPAEDMWQGEFVLFYQQGRFDPEMMDLDYVVEQQLSVGIIQGNSYHEHFWQHFPYQRGYNSFQGDLTREKLHEQLHPVATLRQNLLKVASGRVDVTVANKTYGRYTARLLGIADQLGYASRPLYSKRYPVAFIKRSPISDMKRISDEFSKELAAFKQTAEYQSIVKKWLN